jgi:hypothetical protein
VRWVGFIFTDDAVGLFSPIVSDDRHNMAETHLGIFVRLRHPAGVF